VFVYTQMGVYTIQPIGALPDGVTMAYWRSSGEPFFNSPDATCLRDSGWGVAALPDGGHGSDTG
jgi:hypothetical protein